MSQKEADNALYLARNKYLEALSDGTESRGEPAEEEPRVGSYILIWFADDLKFFKALVLSKQQQLAGSSRRTPTAAKFAPHQQAPRSDRDWPGIGSRSARDGPMSPSAGAHDGHDHPVAGGGEAGGYLHGRADVRQESR